MRNRRPLQPFIIATTVVILAGSIIALKRPVSAPVAQTRALSAFGQLPLSFEARGDAQFIARGAGYSIELRPDEAVLRLRSANRGWPKEKPGFSLTDAANPQSSTSNGRDPQSTLVRMKLAGAHPAPRAEALAPLAGKVNYFIGSDPQAWRAGAPTYAKVRYQSVYPGIDLVYYGNQRQIEYDFIVASGADPRVIRLGFQGADRIEVDAQGDLILHTAGGELRQPKPTLYQEINGARKEIAGGYVMTGASQVGFHLGDYDGSRPLVIDPVMVYSTFFGSGGSEDVPGAIAVDTAGQVYLVGTTGA
ncbi:MAG: SBBP repeat-containing protein, partial [Blastocatellia bacterium]